MRILSRFHFVVATALLLTLAACSQKVVLSRLPAEATIVAFGDSLTWGTGADPEHSYPTVLESLIKRKVVNAGVPGETTEEGLARLPRVLDDTKPMLVILCLGGNDFLRRQDESRTRENLRSMIRLIRSHGADTILLAVPRLGLTVEPHQLYREVGKEEGVAVDEKDLPEVLANGGLKSDYIHPNARGYRQMAEGIAAFLRKAGALEEGS